MTGRRQSAGPGFAGGVDAGLVPFGRIDIFQANATATDVNGVAIHDPGPPDDGDTGLGIGLLAVGCAGVAPAARMKAGQANERHQHQEQLLMAAS